MPWRWKNAGTHSNPAEWPEGAGLLWDQEHGLLAPKLDRDLELCHGSDGKPSTIIHTATLCLSALSRAPHLHDLPGGLKC